MWMWIDCLPSPKMLNLWERARRNGGFPLKKFRITWVRYLPSKPRWKWISTHLWWEKHRKLAGAAQLSGHIRPLECTVINYSDTCMHVHSTSYICVSTLHRNLVSSFVQVCFCSDSSSWNQPTGSAQLRVCALSEKNSLRRDDFRLKQRGKQE